MIVSIAYRLDLSLDTVIYYKHSHLQLIGIAWPGHMIDSSVSVVTWTALVLKEVKNESLYRTSGESAASQAVLVALCVFLEAVIQKTDGK